MKLNDINQTILLQLDPEVAKAIIEAQVAADKWDAVTGAVMGLVMAAIFIALFKYTS
jgi:hypothetical protein